MRTSPLRGGTQWRWSSCPVLTNASWEERTIFLKQYSVLLLPSSTITGHILAKWKLQIHIVPSRQTCGNLVSHLHTVFQWDSLFVVNDHFNRATASWISVTCGAYHSPVVYECEFPWELPHGYRSAIQLLAVQQSIFCIRLVTIVLNCLWCMWCCIVAIRPAFVVRVSAQQLRKLPTRQG